MVVASITGHRPERIPDELAVLVKLDNRFKRHGVSRVIQGMAPGIDLLAARTAFRLGIPFVCAKPYPTHRTYVERNYPSWLTMYDRAIERAAEVITVSDSYEGPWVFQTRNEWMVDNSEILIGVWDKKRKGGTWNCINYATRKNVPTVLVPL